MNDFETKIAEVISMMTADYIDWSGRVAENMGFEEANEEYQVEVEEGRKYIKLIKVNRGGSRSVAGFIVKSDGGKWKAGDMLKAASWKAPATNFSRGNIFTAMPKTIRWTGFA